MPALAEPTSELSPLGRTIYEQKYAAKDGDGKIIEDWPDTAYRVVSNVLGALGYSDGDDEFDRLLELVERKVFMPGGRYLYASGKEMHNTQNCLLLRAEDSREGWADLYSRAAMALMTGCGIGVVYNDVRPAGSLIKKTGGVASGPLPLAQAVNEIGRGSIQGGDRRAAIWGGLIWSHGDIFDWIRQKDWNDEVKAIKAKDFNFPATMDFTNISVILDDEFFAAYGDSSHALNERAVEVYRLTVSKMASTGEPGLSVDVGVNSGEHLRNACCEVSSRDDDDICNLGSINMALIEDAYDMEEAVRLGTLFLLAGTVYSDVPYARVGETRSKNRRLGLGLMGVHEWLLKRGKRYGPDEDLGRLLEIYSQSTEFAAHHADRHGLSRPVKTRAIAPNGTNSIVAGTIGSMEPIFCVAYKRRYLHGRTWKYQYVVDPSAKRLAEEGTDPDTIEDAYTLSYDVERRVEMQAWVQSFVDHGIASTINLPYPITDPREVEDFGDMLYGYLPELRGITCYPDGARGGQPLTKASYREAIESEGVVFEETDNACIGGTCDL